MISNNQASLFAELMLIYNERTKKKWWRKISTEQRRMYTLLGTMDSTTFIARRSLDVRPMKAKTAKPSLLSYRQYKLVTFSTITIFVHCIVWSLYETFFITIWAVQCTCAGVHVFAMLCAVYLTFVFKSTFASAFYSKQFVLFCL